MRSRVPHQPSEANQRIVLAGPHQLRHRIHVLDEHCLTTQRVNTARPTQHVLAERFNVRKGFLRVIDYCRPAALLKPVKHRRNLVPQRQARRNRRDTACLAFEWRDLSCPPVHKREGYADMAREERYKGIEEAVIRSELWHGRSR